MCLEGRQKDYGRRAVNDKEDRPCETEVLYFRPPVRVVRSYGWVYVGMVKSLKGQIWKEDRVVRGRAV